MFSSNSRRSRTHALRLTMIATTAFVTGFPICAMADTSNAPRAIVPDVNEVDVLSGFLSLSEAGVSFGNGANTSLNYRRIFHNGWRDNLTASIAKPLSNQAHIVIGATSVDYTLSGGVWTSSAADGQTLVENTSNFILTQPNGDVFQFDKVPPDGSYPSVSYQNDHVVALLGKITRTSGEVLNFTYTHSSFDSYSIFYRLTSVSATSGYQVHFEYTTDSLSDYSGLVNWWNVEKAATLNLGVDFCDPAAFHCTGLSATAKYVTYGGGGTYTDQFTIGIDGSRVNYHKTTDGINEWLNIHRLGMPGDGRTYEFDDIGRVISVNDDGRLWQYTWNQDGSYLTGQRTDPIGNVSTFYSITDCSELLYQSDSLGHQTNYTYTTGCRVRKVTSPEGNAVQYTYDTRGNVTETRLISKTPGTPPDIVTSALYPSSCVSPKTCNLPTWTKDANGNETDYTYDTTHGGVLTVTSPAPTTGAVRPQTRYSYGAYQAYYKNGTGSVVASGQNQYLLTAISTCQTMSSCSGAADEVKTSLAYGPQTAGTPNNLLPVSATSGSGNGALAATSTFTYDAVGNRITVDGPLSGTADTTRTRYDAARRVVGVVGPDPDGADSLLPRANRFSYGLDGQMTLAEVGTVTDQSDAAWSAFSSQQQIATTYDSSGRPVKQETKAGGTTYALSQTSYDAAGRVDCVAQRMDPAQWSSQTNACIPQTTGPDGPDRVQKTFYNAANQVTKLQVAVGTSDVADDQTYTYSNNGRPVTVKDGQNNLTAYEYDGVDRLSKTRYPSSAAGSGTSSTSDYEQLIYDPNGNVTSRRLRGYAGDSTKHIDFTYDALNRVTFKNLPGSEPDISYAYDNLDRPTTIVDASSKYVGLAYDALGRPTAQSSALGVTGMGYDLAGRRTLTVWPDNFYVTYDYLVTGEMTAVRENGAISGVGVLATYNYDNLGRSTQITRGNGTTTSYGFDTVSRLISLGHTLTGTGNNLALGFSYNSAGQIKSTTRSNDGYAYGGSVNANVAYTVNGLNQDTAVGAGGLGYDARGNLTSTGTNNYTYSSENLLLTGPSSTLTYDPLRRLYGATGSATEFYAYDGQQRVAEYNGSGTMLRRYVYGPGDDEPLVWYEGSGTGDRRWLHADERGSVIAVSNGSGASTGTNSYDEYGVPASGNTGRFQFTGQAWLPDLELYYYKARLYSSRLGRFMQTDPIRYRGGMNLYAYARSDAVNLRDPSGLQSAPSPIGPYCNGAPGACVIGPDNGDITVNGGAVRRSSLRGEEDFGIYSMPSVGDGWNRDLDMQAQVEHALFSGLQQRGSAILNGLGTWAKKGFCSLGNIDVGGGADAYAGLGGSVGGSYKFDITTGQIGADGYIAVGAGLGVEAGPTATVSSSGNSIITANVITQVGGGVGVGVTGTHSWFGTNPGQNAVTVGKVGSPIGFINGGAAIGLHTPKLWDFGC